METSEWKVLLQLKKEVEWKWVDKSGFTFQVKGYMKEPNSITFIQGENRITLNRKSKVDSKPNTNLVEQGNPLNIPLEHAKQPTPYQPPITNNRIQLIDEELNKNIDGYHQQLGTEQNDNQPILPFGAFNYPSEMERDGQPIPDAFEPYVPKIDEINK